MMKATRRPSLKDGEYCEGIAGTHAGKSGAVRDIKPKDLPRYDHGRTEERREIQEPRQERRCPKKARRLTAPSSRLLH